MKRLVSAKDVVAAAARHEDIYVDENTIVTAQAKDVARENGVHITCGPKPEEHAVKEHAACEKGAADHAAVECHKVDLTHEGKGAEPALTAAELEHLIAAAFEKGIWTKDDIETLLGKKESAIDPNVVPVGVSGRHIHLSQHDLETLFGKGYELTKVKDLSQPGQFAAKECVTLAGPKGVIQKVRVLGPVRSQTQVEVLAGDTFKLGVPQEIRLSGHLEGTPGITVIGPKGTVVLPEGVMGPPHPHEPVAGSGARLPRRSGRVAQDLRGAWRHARQRDRARHRDRKPRLSHRHGRGKRVSPQDGLQGPGS